MADVPGCKYSCNTTVHVVTNAPKFNPKYRDLSAIYNTRYKAVWWARIRYKSGILRQKALKI